MYWLIITVYSFSGEKPIQITVEKSEILQQPHTERGQKRLHAKHFHRFAVSRSIRKADFTHGNRTYVYPIIHHFALKFCTRNSKYHVWLNYRVITLKLVPTELSNSNKRRPDNASMKPIRKCTRFIEYMPFNFKQALGARVSQS